MSKPLVGGVATGNGVGAGVSVGDGTGVGNWVDVGVRALAVVGSSVAAVVGVGRLADVGTGGTVTAVVGRVAGVGVGRPQADANNYKAVVESITHRYVPFEKLVNIICILRLQTYLFGRNIRLRRVRNQEG